MIQVQYIACTNDAGFVMSFAVKWLDQSGEWHTTKWDSGHYPIDQTRTTPDLTTIGVPSDAVAIVPFVDAVLGKNETGSPYVQYATNGHTAVFEVKGTTLDYSVKLIGPAAEAQATPAAAVGG